MSPVSAAALLTRLGMTPEWRAEARTLVGLSAPVMGTYLIGFSNQMLSMLLVGHVSAAALASAALGNMYINMVSSSVLYGCSSACDTLSSQAVGARNLARVGHITQRGILVMLSLFAPISVALYHSDKLLTHMGQEPEVVALSADYVRYLAIGSPALLTYEILKKHLQACSVMWPPMAISTVALGVNGLLGYALVYHTRLSFLGAPVAAATSSWAMLALMAAYFRWHRAIHAAMRRARERLACLACCRRRAAYVRAGQSDEQGVELATPRGGGGGGDGQARRPSAAELSVASGGEAAAGNGNASNAAADGPGPRGGDATDAGAGADAEATALVGAVTPVKPTGVTSPAAGAAGAQAAAAVDVDDLLDATLVDMWTAKAALSGWWEFLSLGMPSAAMLFVEWASFEFQSLIAGLVSTTALASHTVLSVTAGIAFMPALGISVAASVRIGQRMGDTQAPLAKRTYRVAVALVGVYELFNACFVAGIRGVWGRTFTDDAAVIDMVGRYLPILALYSLFDGGQCVLSGVMRGVGRPGLAAMANVVAYVVLAIPVGYALGVEAGVGLPGIWAGNLLGVCAACVCQAIILSCLNWEREAVVAHTRAAQGLSAKPTVALEGDAEAADAGSDASNDHADGVQEVADMVRLVGGRSSPAVAIADDDDVLSPSQRDAVTP